MTINFDVIFIYVSVCLYSVCQFLTVSQTAGPIGTKLGTRIQLDPDSVLGKSRSGQGQSSAHVRMKRAGTEAG